jgi:hypothetical protein
LHCDCFLNFKKNYFLLRTRAKPLPPPFKRLKIYFRGKICDFFPNLPKKIYKVFHIFHALYKNGVFKINLLYNIMKINIKISKL